MCFLDQFDKVLVPYDLMVLESTEDRISCTEAIEARTEDAFVQELVLREEVQRTVRDRRSGQDQVELADLAKPVQCF